MTLFAITRHPLVRLGVASLFATASLHWWWGKPGSVIHQSGINIGYAGQPPVGLDEASAVLIFAFAPALTANDTHLFLGTSSLPVWPAIAAVFAGLLLKGLSFWRDHRLTTSIGNSLLVFGFLVGLLVVSLLSTSAGAIGPGVLFLMAAAVAGIITGPSRREQGNGTESGAPKL